MNSSKMLLKFIKPLSNSLKYSTRLDRSCIEVSIPVPWGHVAGKWWGPTDKRPVLSIHGWQDNCGTWNRLIPMLDSDKGFLAIDLPGHGLSSKLPSGMYYHSSNYVILVRHLMKYFEWNKISLMGHSLGGIITYMYGMIYPEDVDLAICIDASKPMIINNNNVRMAKLIDDFLRYSKYDMSTKEPPAYTIDEIKKKICAPNRDSVLYEQSHHIMDRNIAPSKVHPGKYYFTRDIRLKCGILMNMPQEETLQFTENMTFPIFIGKATKSSYYEPKENFYAALDVLKRVSKDCDFHYVEGTHHVHLNEPEKVADLLNNFIARNDEKDRSKGGIKDEMLVVNEEIQKRVAI